MKEVKKILIPIDYSPEVIRVLFPYAQYFAMKLDAEIHLLYVQETMELFDEFNLPEDDFKTIIRNAFENAKKRMERIINEEFKGLEVKTSYVVIGDAASIIVKYAEKKDFDLILMGTHGRKGADKIVFGSVAYRVAKKATCPVLTVNPYRIKESVSA
jgi:nucleotide-binding universal stress UspA family protein